MGKSLYRSYRSTSFDEIIGQEHITTTLKNALKTNSISHAYLLSGPRGTGKTSIARILAYAVNDQPYDLEGQNLDIIEIDAASNRRIDEIREIRERVHIAPTIGKYKIYIIDEVHMLTREAFNALLKTLEEPPQHVIFILATTETHKVPETIASRCIRLTFKPIEPSAIAEHLKAIARKEKIDITDDAISLLSIHARGSFRDAISLLEQVKHLGSSIEEEQVANMLGLAPDTLINSLVDAITAHNPASISKTLIEAFDSGAGVGMICSQLHNRLREMLVTPKASALTPDKILGLQKNLLSVPGSVKPAIELEITLYEAALGSEPSHTQTPRPQIIPAKTETPPSKPQKSVRPQQAKPMEAAAKPPQKSEPIKPAKSSPNSDLWEECLTILKGKNNTLYGIARMATFTQNGDAVNLSFRYSFHHKQLNDPKNKVLFSRILSDLYGSPVTLTTEITTEPQNPPQNSNTDEVLENVSNIFGTHEVLES